LKKKSQKKDKGKIFFWGLFYGFLATFPNVFEKKFFFNTEKNFFSKFSKKNQIFGLSKRKL